MTQIRTQPEVFPVPETIQQQVTPFALAAILAQIKGSSFLSTVCRYDMLAKGKMLKKHPVTKEPNPFLKHGLWKISEAQQTVNFNYEDKVDRRGGEHGETKGTWHTLVLIDNHVTPLSVHKADIETYVPDGMEDKINNRRAVVVNGNLHYLIDAPRLYLRYELVRDAGEGSRQDRKMRCESYYVDHEGKTVDKELVKPFVPDKERFDETDFQVTALTNVERLTIDRVRYVVT